jgi:hypothetical protein
MKPIKIDIIWLIVLLIVLLVIFKQCEGEPRTVTKTETVVKWKTDTIIQEKTKIQKVKEPVYVEKVKTLKGDTVVVFKDKETDNTIQTKQYETEIKSDSATARLLITANELYDVSGTITYPRTEKTIETIKMRDKSGFYIYGQLPINDFTSPEMGLQYNIRNALFISTGVQYNSITNKPNINVGIGVKIF